MYTRSVNRLIKICLILAPVFLIVSSLYDGLVKDDLFLQGVFGQYGGMFLIGANVAIAGWIGKSRASLGVVSLVLGVIGAFAAGAGNMALYTMEIIGELKGFEARELLFAMTEEPDPKQFAAGWVGLMMPLSLLANGIFLLIANVGKKWVALCILLAGVLFFLGQGVFALSVVLSPSLLLVAFFVLAFDDRLNY